MPDVSVCFLGTGRINARHIQTLKQLRPQARIAVASRDRRRARAFGERFGARDSYGSYEDAIASDYETIVIGVPPSAHRSLVELALTAGKHLLIEKPVFASFDELEALWPRLVRHRATVMVVWTRREADRQSEDRTGGGVTPMRRGTKLVHASPSS